MDRTISKPLIVLLALYITALFASNTLGIKLMPFVLGTHLSVAVFFFPIVFIMTDIVGEVYGKKMAKNFVFAGVISILVFMLFSAIALVAPWSESSLWAKEGYNSLFGLSLRFSLASLAAFAIAEYQDVMAFFFFKKKTEGKGFWLRSNLSNLWSQFLDSAIFSLIAFLGVYSISTIVLITIPWWIYKVAMGAAFTPLSYLGIRILRKYDHGLGQT